MRVVHVHRISGIGGSERHLLALLPALRAQGIEPSFVGLDDPRGAPEPFYAALEEAGIPFARVPSRHDLDPRLPFRIARAARPLPAGARAHPSRARRRLMARQPPCCSACRWSRRSTTTIRSGPARSATSSACWPAARAGSSRSPSRSRASTRSGSGSRTRSSRSCTTASTRSRPRGARTRRWSFRTARACCSRLGRLVPQKGLDVAVRALPAIRASHPDAVLVIAGEGRLP